MKILAFTDFHGSKKAMRIIEETVNQEKPDLLICSGDFTIFNREIEKIMNWMDNLGVKTLLLHGNHENEKDVENLSANSKNIVFLHKKSFQKETIVTITHPPPHGTTLDYVGFHGGSKSVRQIIKTNDIKLHICGHIHEGFN